METLVFLHGGIGPINYQELIDPLRKDFKIIAPDLYDLTETKNFSWEKFAKNLNKRIGKKKVYLLGSSLGGGLALTYASLYPQKVKAVIACEPIGLQVKEGLITILTWTFRLSKMMIRASFNLEDTSKVLKFFFIFLKEQFLNSGKLFFCVKMAYKEDLEEFLPGIKAPVYLLWSKNSGVLSLEMGERFHQRIPDSKFIPDFSDKNHLWCLLEQEKVAQGVKKIFRETSTRGERGLKSKK